MKIKTLLVAMAFAMPLTALPTVAYAQEAEAEEPTPTWDLSGEVGAASDYRFRGISLSGKEPEAMASISLAHQSGLYASAWGSNVELGSGKADDLEVDWTMGFSKDVGRINVDVGGIYYSYLGNKGFNYFEVYGSLGTKVGPADMKVGVAYAPSQTNIGSQDNTYVYVSGEMPLGDGPVSLHGTFGFENGAFGSNKKDWLVGMSVDLGSGLTGSIDYVDTARSFSTNGDPIAVASLKFGF
ncbi:MAG: TorF family putative porin [Novosphingobium sp.]|uniref:TorF family putative porin n=1 Tax=Novosphingobium sp. TaxID=1874826 RepID=UPI0032B96382